MVQAPALIFLTSAPQGDARQPAYMGLALISLQAELN
jgi:hypothetical protein